jgi:hypothetical protein
MPPDTSKEDIDWCMPLRVAQPLQCFEQKLKLTGAVEKLPRTYIYCTRSRPDDVFRQFADRARSEKGWTCHDIDASHNPHITCPDVLMELLDRIAKS